MSGDIFVDSIFAPAIGVKRPQRSEEGRVVAINEAVELAKLAETNGMLLCFEGVETAEMRDDLSRFGRVLLQGYYFDRPLKAEDFSCLPLAYIEIAEFDCLHDDGINYARKLKAVGIRSYLKEIPGTMHSYDMTLQAPTTRRVMHRRIRFLRRMFRTEE